MFHNVEGGGGGAEICVNISDIAIEETAPYSTTRVWCLNCRALAWPKSVTHDMIKVRLCIALLQDTMRARHTGVSQKNIHLSELWHWLGTAIKI
jgi:hypothetical protein